MDYKKVIEDRANAFDEASYYGSVKRKNQTMSHIQLFKHQVQEFMFMHKLVSQGIRQLSNLKILDCGCGDGRNLRRMIDLGASPDNLYGVDVSLGVIELAKELSSPKINFQHSHGHELPYETEYMDIATINGVLQAVLEDEVRIGIAKEMTRVVKRGGLIIVSDLCIISEYRNLKDMESKPVNRDIISELYSDCEVIDYQKYLLNDLLLNSPDFTDWGKYYNAAISDSAASAFCFAILKKKE